MTRLKIDGLREARHARAAADAGADFLGFVFVPGVRRQLSEAEGRRVIDEYRESQGSGGPTVVGLFANQPLSEVNRISETCGLDMAQLCGDELPDYWAQVGVPVIRQIKVRDGVDPALTTELVGEVVTLGHVACLDSHQSGSFGGTGRTFDWSIAKDVARHHDFLLAGGLDPDNVGDAIETVGPWGVDVSSGVETNGIKDLEKIAAFAKRVRAHDDRG